jgi:RNA exonuclease NGL2
VRDMAYGTRGRYVPAPSCTLKLIISQPFTTCHVTRLTRHGADLNTTPCEAVYQLLITPSTPLPATLLNEVETSRIVHTSVEKVGLSLSAPPSTSGIGSKTPVTANQAEEADESEGDGEAENEEELPDSHEKSIAGTRSPHPSDGILPMDTLVGLLSDLIPDGVRSAYVDSPWSGKEGTGETFEERGGFERVKPDDVGLRGGQEPGYTCYTPLFKLTLGMSGEAGSSMYLD